MARCSLCDAKPLKVAMIMGQADVVTRVGRLTSLAALSIGRFAQQTADIWLTHAERSGAFYWWLFLYTVVA